MSGILLCDDLLFSSRIGGIARDLNLDLKIVRSAEALRELVQMESPACVILDLSHPGVFQDDLLVQLTQGTKPFLVAFGSHVDTQILNAARAGGCDVVWPRSKFVQELPQALPQWLNP